MEMIHFYNCKANVKISYKYDSVLDWINSYSWKCKTLYQRTLTLHIPFESVGHLLHSWFPEPKIIHKPNSLRPSWFTFTLLCIWCYCPGINFQQVSLEIILLLFKLTAVYFIKSSLLVMIAQMFTCNTCFSFKNCICVFLTWTNNRMKQTYIVYVRLKTYILK